MSVLSVLFQDVISPNISLVERFPRTPLGHRRMIFLFRLGGDLDGESDRLDGLPDAFEQLEARRRLGARSVDGVDWNSVRGRCDARAPG
jgi:hypothetical protein